MVEKPMSYDLIKTNDEAQAAMREMAKKRYTSGANREPETSAYRRALQLSTKRPPSGRRDLVIAHCDEDLSWVNHLAWPSCNTFIYSKGVEKVGTKLPNVGREFHTYFTHIVDNYDTLADVTFFLQGWPFDRSSGIVPALHWLQNIHYIEFGTDILDTGETDEQMKGFWDFMLDNSDTEPRSKQPNGWCFRANVQCAVSRDVLRRRPLKFYRGCQYVLEYGIQTLDIKPETVPYLMEQVWPFIFS
jgi:hypothetical protein